MTDIFEQIRKACETEALAKMLNNLRSPQRRAWRTYAAATLTGTASNVTEDEIPALCHMAAEIADEMVRREAEREAEDE